MVFIRRIPCSLLGGAIGDAIGSYYEGTSPQFVDIFHNNWKITDDTLLTLATCKSIFENRQIQPSLIAKEFLEWYNKKKLVGLGSATIQALDGLKVGGHWALVGKRGEFAAGNGAAMRIAPVAFSLNFSNDDELTLFRDIVNITHNNDEAYAAALAVALVLRYSIMSWKPEKILRSVIQNIPDSNTRDKLISAQEWDFKLGLKEASKILGTSGYAAESVPLAIYSALVKADSRFEELLEEIILVGGDTDTIASMACQIFGAYNTAERISSVLRDRIPQKSFVEEVIKNYVSYIRMAL